MGALLVAVSLVGADDSPFEIDGPGPGKAALLANKPQYPVVFRANGVTLMIPLDYCLEWAKRQIPPVKNPVLEHFRVVRALIPPSTVIDLGAESKPDGWGWFTSMVLEALHDRQVYCIEHATGATVSEFEIRQWSTGDATCGQAGRRVLLPDGSVVFSVADIAW